MPRRRYECNATMVLDLLLVEESFDTCLAMNDLSLQLTLNAAQNG
jgi:hypothetical protein